MSDGVYNYLRLVCLEFEAWYCLYNIIHIGRGTKRWPLISMSMGEYKVAGNSVTLPTYKTCILAELFSICESFLNSRISSRLTIPTSSCTMQVLSYPWELQYGEFYTTNLLTSCCLDCCQGPGTTFTLTHISNFLL